MDLYHGNLRAIDHSGGILFDHIDYQDYLSYISEEVRSWSYMKFPFIKSMGPENGWYRVGPLARLNTCDFIDTPEAEKARKKFAAITQGTPNNISMAYHWARMIERPRERNNTVQTDTSERRLESDYSAQRRGSPDRTARVAARRGNAHVGGHRRGRAAA